MAERAGSGKRRGLIVGLVVAVVLLLVLVPAFVTSRPGYFGRFDDLKSKYEPWKTSTHVAARCQDCHVAPGLGSQAAYAVQSIGGFYAALLAPSRTPEHFASPTNASCLACHEDLRSISPEGDLLIPHRAHVNILKMDCVECHDYLVHEISPEGAHRPTMAGCLTCHDGDTAKNTCSACHTSKATPESHKVDDWLIVHDDAAAREDCDSCHAWTEDWCVDCHSKRPASHTDDWRAVHGEQVAKRRTCEACHDAAFCEKCHGVVPPLNYDPALKLVE
jgi:hypothetical protein